MSEPYTHTNIDTIEDVAPSHGMEMGEARFLREALGAELVGMAFYRMKPGKRLGFGHRHDQAEEIYVVLEGSGRLRLEDEIRDVVRLDVIRVSPPVMREFEAGSDGLTVLAAGNHVKGDGHMDPTFWKD